MTLVLDFGTASIKALLLGDPGQGTEFFSFCLGFRANILSRESLLTAVRQVQTLSGRKLLDGEKILPTLYLSVGLPVYESVRIVAAPVILTSQALAALEMNVLDVGCELTHFRDKVSILPPVPAETVRWLLFKADESEVANYLENKKIYSSLLPHSPRDLFLEQALARARLIDFFRSQRLTVDFEEIYLSGAVFARAPFGEQVVLMALDGLQPTGLLKIWLDTQQILPVMGVLKYHSLETFSRLGDEFDPVFLATTLTLDDDCNVKVDLGLESPQEIDLKKGDLYVFPLALGETATIEVQPRARKKAVATYEVTGGRVGVVFDLRGRPLTIPDSPNLRCGLLKSWHDQIGAAGNRQKI